MAQLITQGKSYGIHPFILQIRSLEDHSTLPGIILGDIGPKFGYNTQDNGFMRLDNVRVPRESLLMRYAKVDSNGNYTRPPHSKISYLTMVKVRSGLVSSASCFLAMATCIATRYSAIRKQGYLPGESKNQPETTILDFQLQLKRLLVQVSTAYAFWITGIQQNGLYLYLTKRIT